MLLGGFNTKISAVILLWGAVLKLRRIVRPQFGTRPRYAQVCRCGGGVAAEGTVLT